MNINLNLNLNSLLNLKNESISTKSHLLTHHLIVLNSNDTLEVALRKFSGVKILSVPVLLSNGMYTVLSIMDILDSIVDINNEVVLTMPVEQFCSTFDLFFARY